MNNNNNENRKEVKWGMDCIHHSQRKSLVYIIHLQTQQSIIMKLITALVARCWRSSPCPRRPRRTWEHMHVPRRNLVFNFFNKKHEGYIIIDCSPYFIPFHSILTLIKDVSLHPCNSNSCRHFCIFSIRSNRCICSAIRIYFYFAKIYIYLINVMFY